MAQNDLSSILTKEETMKKLPLAIAVTAAILSSSAAFAVDLETHGYARAGVGGSVDGGSQVCYGNGGSAGHVVGRLGDECDMYAELSFNFMNLYENGDNKFNFHTLVAYGTHEDGGPMQRDTRGNSFQAIGTDESDGPWSGGRAAFREAWVDFQMDNGMTLWAGNRYYGRKDIHILDLYYINNSGYGIGVENIQAGPGKIQAAYVQHRWKPGFDGATTPTDPNGKPVDQYQGNTTAHTLDLRYTDLSLGGAGSLEFIALLAAPSYSDDQQKAIDGKVGNYTDYGLDETGYSLTVEHTYGFDSGFNKAIIQYSAEGYAWDTYGGNSHMGSGYNMETGQKGRATTRLIDWGVISGDKWDLGYSFIWSMLDNDGDTGTRTNLVVRPSYKWSETMSTVLEAGYYIQDDPWMKESENLTKVTIAQQWQAGKSFWARPSIRVFASAYGGDQAVDNNDLMFGAQVETWW